MEADLNATAGVQLRNWAALRFYLFIFYSWYIKWQSLLRSQMHAALNNIMINKQFLV
jgi:hypothetical protein